MSYFNKRLIAISISATSRDESQASVEQAIKDAITDTGAPVWIEGDLGMNDLQIAGPTLADLVTVAKKFEDKTGSRFRTGEPSPAFMETVTVVAAESKTGRAPNNRGTITIVASPLSARLVEDIEQGAFDPTQETPSLVDKLVNGYEWDEASAKNVLAFGGANGGSNVIVNLTKTPLPATTIPGIVRAFNVLMMHGPLVSEVMRATRFDITATTLVSPEIKGTDINCATLEAIRGASVRAGPSLYQPVYDVEMTISVGPGGPEQVLNKL